MGILCNDPGLGVDWPLALGEAFLSAKDKINPRLRDLPVYFT